MIDIGSEWARFLASTTALAGRYMDLAEYVAAATGREFADVITIIALTRMVQLEQLAVDTGQLTAVTEDELDELKDRLVAGFPHRGSNDSTC